MLAELSARPRQLPPEERAQLAEGLLESLQEWSSPEIEVAWDAEILKRIGEYERGEAALSPAVDVFAEARRLSDKCALSWRGGATWRRECGLGWRGRAASSCPD